MERAPWIWMAIALGACEPDARIGEVMSDAGADPTGPDAEPLDGVAACDCGADSCGARQCGRSDCGYPCGTCPTSQHCQAGGACAPGSGPGVACSDAFDWYGWGNVWEGDRGLRLCPGDPQAVEACTCSGDGPDAWIDCTGVCFAPCVGVVHCGPATCSLVEYCQGCSDGVGAATYACRPRNESNGSCGASGGMPFDVFCDGDEDCAATDQCMAVVGDIVRLTCERDDSPPGCEVGAGYYELCETSADCTTCTDCSELKFADWATDAYDLRLCRTFL